MSRCTIESLEARLCFSAGQLDKSFADGGILTLPANVQVNTATLADGRILVYGSQGASNQGNYAPYVERYLANGRVDPTFPQSALASRLTQLFGNGDFEFGLDADQRLLVTGSGAAQDAPYVIVRIRSDGTLDPKMGVAGVATVPSTLRPISISGLPGGRIVMDGYVANNDDDAGPDGDDPLTIVGIAAFNSRGKLEKSFGKNGIAEATSWVDMDDEEISVGNYIQHDSFIPLDDGTFIYLLSVERDAIGGAGEDDQDATEELTSSIDTIQYNTDGTTTGNFSTGQFGFEGWLLDAKKDADGTIRLFYVQDKSPAGQPNTDYKLFSATLASDGTVIATELAKDVDPPPFAALGQADGTLLGDLLDNGLSRYITGKGLDNSLVVPTNVTSNSASFIGGTITNDGQILATYDRIDSQENHAEFLTKLQSSDASTGTLFAGPIIAAKSTAYRFKITWQDAKSVEVHSLDNHDVVVNFPDGSEHPAKLIATDKQRNSGVITATYRVAAPAGGWSAADDGTYAVSVRANHVWDTAGHSAQAMSFGVFNVRIPVVDSAPPAVGSAGVTVSTPVVTTPTPPSMAQDILG